MSGHGTLVGVWLFLVLWLVTMYPGASDCSPHPCLARWQAALSRQAMHELTAPPPYNLTAVAAALAYVDAAPGRPVLQHLASLDPPPLQPLKHWISGQLSRLRDRTASGLDAITEAATVLGVPIDADAATRIAGVIATLWRKEGAFRESELQDKPSLLASWHAVRTLGRIGRLADAAAGKTGTAGVSRGAALVKYVDALATEPGGFRDQFGSPHDPEPARPDATAAAAAVLEAVLPLSGSDARATGLEAFRAFLPACTTVDGGLPVVCLARNLTEHLAMPGDAIAGVYGLHLLSQRPELRSATLERFVSTAAGQADARSSGPFSIPLPIARFHAQMPAIEAPDMSLVPWYLVYVGVTVGFLTIGTDNADVNVSLLFGFLPITLAAVSTTDTVYAHLVLPWPASQLLLPLLLLQVAAVLRYSNASVLGLTARVLLDTAPFIAAFITLTHRSLVLVYADAGVIQVLGFVYLTSVATRVFLSSLAVPASSTTQHLAVTLLSWQLCWCTVAAALALAPPLPLSQLHRIGAVQYTVPALQLLPISTLAVAVLACRFLPSPQRGARKAGKLKQD